MQNMLIKKSMKKSKKVRCYVCKKFFGNAGAKAVHYKAQHFVPPPPPKPPETLTFVGYKSLVQSSNWGEKMSEQTKNNPPDRVLQLGYLAKILDTLEEILGQLKKQRIIT